MPILVSTKPEHLIEVSIKYFDKGKNGVVVFNNDAEAQEWISNKQEQFNEEHGRLTEEEQSNTPKKDAEALVKELKTWWKRTDWGSQAKIMQESQKIDSDGKIETDWVNYRFAQMKYLLIRWNLKDSKGNEIPVNEKLFKRLDYDVASKLLAEYDLKANTSEEDVENFG